MLIKRDVHIPPHPASADLDTLSKEFVESHGDYFMIPGIPSSYQGSAGASFNASVPDVLLCAFHLLLCISCRAGHSAAMV